MLNVVAAAAAKLYVAGGSITSPNSALFHPNFKYSHHQVVSGVIFDSIVTVSLLAAMFYAAYKYWGPPAKKKIAAQGFDNSTTLREEGMLLGIQPWVWSLISMASLAFVVILSKVVVG